VLHLPIPGMGSDIRSVRGCIRSSMPGCTNSTTPCSIPGHKVVCTVITGSRSLVLCTDLHEVFVEHVVSQEVTHLCSLGYNGSNGRTFTLLLCPFVCPVNSLYRIPEGMAVIHTLDFFTPVVDDPYDFGQIAAANALSDIYAMGGEPMFALNVVCWPVATWTFWSEH